MNKKLGIILASIIVLMIITIPVYGMINNYGDQEYANKGCCGENRHGQMFTNKHILDNGISIEDCKTFSLVVNGVGDARTGDVSVNGDFTLNLHAKRKGCVAFKVIDGEITVVGENFTTTFTVERGIAIANLKKHTIRIIVKLDGECDGRMILFGFWVPKDDGSYSIHLLFYSRVKDIGWIAGSAQGTAINS